MSEEALASRPHSWELVRGGRVQTSLCSPGAARGGGTDLLIDVVGGAIATVLFYVRRQRLVIPARLLGVQTRLDLWGTGPVGTMVARATISSE
jgi:hypothetical protein